MMSQNSLMSHKPYVHLEMNSLLMSILLCRSCILLVQINRWQDQRGIRRMKWQQRSFRLPGGVQTNSLDILTLLVFNSLQSLQVQVDQGLDVACKIYLRAYKVLRHRLFLSLLNSLNREIVVNPIQPIWPSWLASFFNGASTRFSILLVSLSVLTLSGSMIRVLNSCACLKGV